MDLRGKTFGYWTVLDDKPKNGGADMAVMYRCRCICGEERWVRAGNLAAGRTQSCGCMSHVTSRERRKEIKAKMGNNLTVGEQAIVNLFNDGRTITEIGQIVHRSKSTVRLALDKAGVDRSQLGRRAPLSEDKKEAIIRLYNGGERQYRIAQKLGIPNSTIRDVLSNTGLLTPKRNKGAYYGAEYNKSVVTHAKFHDAIKPVDIFEKRMSIHVDDEMFIPTMKTGGKKTKFQVVEPTMRQAIVVSTDDPRFCIFRLKKTGILDCVNWVDLIMMDRLKETAGVVEV